MKLTSSRAAAIVVIEYAVLLIIMIGLALGLWGCTSITSSNVVCDATLNADSVVVSYVSHPPGNEDLCWRVYGDSLAPAIP